MLAAMSLGCPDCGTLAVMKKDTEYYDAESVRYSVKRYPAYVSTYVQSFYAERLRIVHTFLGHLIKPGVSLIEIGCADGVVIKSIHDAFPNMFSRMIGVDISRGMIDVARSSVGGKTITFNMRDSLTEGITFDVVLEVGVINYANAHEEFRFARSLLSSDGVYVCSIAGTNSLWHMRSPRDNKGFLDFRTYADYERLMQEHFTIETAIGVGLFIPHIWKLPAFARVIQPIAERLLRRIVPNAFHEKVYVLIPRE